MEATNMRWVPRSCHVSISIPEVKPGAKYTGISSIVYDATEREDIIMEENDEPQTKTDSQAAMSSSPEIAPVIVFHIGLSRIEINNIAVTSGKKAVRWQSWKQDEAGEVRLRMPPFDASLMSCEVLINFTSSIAAANAHKVGLYCCSAGGSTGSANRGAAFNCLLSHFEVHHARNAWPCPDDPLLRLSSWNLQATLPKAFTSAFSNTQLVETKQGVGAGGAMTAFSFAKTSGDVLLPAYVMSLAAFHSGVVRVVDQEYTSSVVGVDEDGTSTSTPIQVRMVSPVSSKFPMALLQQHLLQGLRLLETTFGCAIPVESSKLDIIVVPLMDLGGMEHHGCIFLNESLCGSTSCISGTSTASGRKSEKRVEEDIAQIVVHELAHHWIGNAIGLPFELKEGVCLILEQCLGKPMRKFSKQQQDAASNSNDAAATDEDLRGRELTAKTYLDANRKMQLVVSELGWEAFVERLQQLVTQRWGTYVSGEEFAEYFVV